MTAGDEEKGKAVAGEALASEAREEIERFGLAEVLTARYLPDLGVVRIGRQAADGSIPRGVDYPPELGWAKHIREHLEIYRRLSGRGRGDLKSLIWIGVFLSSLAS